MNKLSTGLLVLGAIMLILPMVPIPMQITTYTFGRTDLAPDGMDYGDTIVGSVFLCPADGYAESISAQLAGFFGGTHVKCALYQYDTLALIDVTEERTGGLGGAPGGEFYKFIFPDPPAISNGVEYVFAAWSDDDVVIFRAVVTGSKSLAIWSAPYDGNFPATLEGAMEYNWELGIFCSYTTGTPPPTWHGLTVNCEISGITYTVDSSVGTVGTPLLLVEGDYSIEMPSTFQSGDTTYSFSQWDDGDSNPQKGITLNSDLTLIATYEEESSPPPPGQGNLEVHAFLNEIEVDAEIAADGTTFNTTNLGSTRSLDTGTYTVTARYRNETLSETVTILEDQTTRVDFQFTATTTTIPPISQEEPFPSRLAIELMGVASIIAALIIEKKPRRKE